jgi:hypothetical protein
MIQLLLITLSIALTALLAGVSLHYAVPGASLARDQVYAIDLLNSAQQAQASAYDQAEGGNGRDVPAPKAAATGSTWQYGRALVWIQIDPARASAVCDRIVKIGGVRDYDDAWVDDSVAVAALENLHAGYGCLGVGTVYFALRI